MPNKNAEVSIIGVICQPISAMVSCFLASLTIADSMELTVAKMGSQVTPMILVGFIYGMKLLIYSGISTVQLLKFGSG